MRPERLELPTACSEDKCSIQLSYERNFNQTAIIVHITANERGFQGNRILIACGQDLQEVIFFQGGLEVFGMHTAFGGFLLFEQVESNMAQDS